MIYEVSQKLSAKGMKHELAVKNLCECDMYFIDALDKML